MLSFVLITSKDGSPLDPSLVSAIDRVDFRELVAVPDQHLTWSNASKTVHFSAWQSFTELGRIGSHWHLDYDKLTAFSGLPYVKSGRWNSDETWGLQVARKWPAPDASTISTELSGPYGLIQLHRQGPGAVICDPLSGVQLYTSEPSEALVISNRASLAARSITPAGDQPVKSVFGAGGMVITGGPIGGDTGYLGVATTPIGAGFDIAADGRAIPRSASPRSQLPPDQALDALESHLRETLRSLAGMPFRSRQLILDKTPRSRLVETILKSEGIADQFCHRHTGGFYGTDANEHAFLLSGALPFGELGDFADLSGRIQVSAVSQTIGARIPPPGTPMTKPDSHGEARTLVENSLLHPRDHEYFIDHLKRAMLDSEPHVETLGQSRFSRFQEGQLARGVSILNEIAPVPTIHLFPAIQALNDGGHGSGSLAQEELAVQLLQRFQSRSEQLLDSDGAASGPAKSSDPIQEWNGLPDPIVVRQLLQRYRRQTGNPIFEIVDESAVAALHDAGVTTPEELRAACSFVTAAIWLGHDEQQVRIQRSDNPAVVVESGTPGHAHSRPTVARLLRCQPDSIADPLEWASELVARPHHSSLTKDTTVCGLIPHLAAERFLADAIDSLVKQTRLLQAIVVIDDHSPEPPIDIVRQFPGVTLLYSPETCGPFRLVQEVINNTTFDAYLFQDADDWSAPDRLEILLAESMRTGAELVGSQGMRLIDRESEAVAYDHSLDPVSDLQRHPIGNPVHHPSSLITRDLLVRVGGFATGFRFGADTEFIRRASHVAGIRNVANRLYFYRTRDDSLTGSALTGIRSEARQLNWATQHSRARSNAERREHNLAPMLLPLAVAAPICLDHLEGPVLPGADQHDWPHQASSHRNRTAFLPDNSSSRPVRHTRITNSLPRPIFVIGAARSGASTLAIALSQHSNIAPVYDIGWLTSASAMMHSTYWNDQKRANHSSLSALGIEVEEFVAQFGMTINNLLLYGPATGLTPDSAINCENASTRSDKSGQSRWVTNSDKLHESAFALHRLFPYARFVHVLRDAEQVVESLSTDNSRLYRSMFVHFKPEQAYDLWIDAVRRCHQVEKALGAEYVLRVEREELMEAPSQTLKTVLEFVGEPFQNAVLRPFR